MCSQHLLVHPQVKFLASSFHLWIKRESLNRHIETMHLLSPRKGHHQFITKAEGSGEEVGEEGDADKLSGEGEVDGVLEVWAFS